METGTTLLICRTICTYIEPYHKSFLWNRQAPYLPYLPIGGFDGFSHINAIVSVHCCLNLAIETYGGALTSGRRLDRDLPQIFAKP